MVVLVCYFFTVPLDQIIGFVQDEYASRHPDFEGWGLILFATWGLVVGQAPRKVAHKSPLSLLMVALGENPATSRKKKSLGVGVGVVGVGVGMGVNDRGKPELDVNDGDLVMGSPAGVVQSDHPHHPQSSLKPMGVPTADATPAESLHNSSKDKNKTTAASASASARAGGASTGGGADIGSRSWFSPRLVVVASSKTNRNVGGDEDDEEGNDDDLASHLEQGLGPAPGQVPVAMTSDHPHQQQHHHHHHLDGYIYHDFLTPREELVLLTQDIRSFFRQQLQHLPLASSLSLSSTSESSQISTARVLESSQISTARAVQEALRINPDGTFLPLTWRQSWLYRNRQHKLEKKIAYAKGQSRVIVEEIRDMDASEEAYKDVALIHHFILEQIHWFYRISLKQNLFGFEIPPQVISPLPWLLAWVFVLLSYGFFLYWTLVWGLTNGQQCLGSWGLYFGINMAEDIFFTQVMKILVLRVGSA